MESVTMTFKDFLDLPSYYMLISIAARHRTSMLETVKFLIAREHCRLNSNGSPVVSVKTYRHGFDKGLTQSAGSSKARVRK